MEINIKEFMTDYPITDVEDMLNLDECASFKKAVKIIQRLELAGCKAVLAGGCVRDILLGQQPKDFDIATNALPDEIEMMFVNTIAVGKQFGVIVVVFGDEEFEVATFRSDGEYTDGRRPDDVLLHGRKDCSDIEAMIQDAQRRDLTINGMFYDPTEEVIYDFVEGMSDIKDKKIRFIGKSRDRIAEDKLRMMRALRFTLRLDHLGFTLGAVSMVEISRYAEDIKEVSNERIRDELCKMLQINPRLTINILSASRLLPEVLPEVFNMIGCEQPEQFHPEGDVFVHTQIALKNLPVDASQELIWGTLLHDVGKPVTQTFEDRIRFNGHAEAGVRITEEILQRLKFPTKFIERVKALVGCHMKWMDVTKMRKSKLKRFLAMDHFDEHKALHYADCMASHGNTSNIFFVDNLNFSITEIKPPKLITGKDLIALGMQPGKDMGDLLKRIEDLQLEDQMKDRDSALEFAKQCLSAESFEFFRKKSLK